MHALTKSRATIQQLSTQLANQIAAGEVVERPASVVKELLENSLDAGATQIEIDIQAGGTQQIRIRDNGYGIPQDELALALSPHATSKIRSIDDLVHVASMGFRGEALASIASVSELVLTSATLSADNKSMAWSIKLKDEQVDLTPASHPVGTTVEVNNLFYNTPARRRFLKAERTEYRHIEDVVKRIALARFDVAINFKHNQRQVFALAAAHSHENQLKRLSRLISKEFIQSAVELNFENAGLRLNGWVANAEYSRSQSDMQYFFVNGRMIRDKVITHAVRQAFQDSLYPGRFPVYVLQLTMDPEQVDVNVHPTKHEVRFRQGRLVHDFLFYSLREALTRQTGSPETADSNLAGSSYTSSSMASFNSNVFSKDTSIKESTHTYSSVYQALAAKQDLDKPLGVAIAKLNNDYLLAQNTRGLLVIALVEARKTLLQQQFNDALAGNNKLTAKPVLIPFNLQLKTNATTWLEQQQPGLQQLGFEFSLLGEKEIMLRQVPALLNVTDLKNSVEDFIQLIEDLDSQSALLDVIVNDQFSDDPVQWNALLRQLEQLEQQQIDHCYHQVTETELARWFK